MDITTIVRALTPLTDAFEFYGIPYYLTGSLAISVYVVKAQAVQGIVGVPEHIPTYRDHETTGCRDAGALLTTLVNVPFVLSAPFRRLAQDRGVL